VPFSNLLPGDILFFSNTIWNGISHAGIYIGGGKFIHSEWYGKGVRVTSFYNDPADGNYWIQHYTTANRPWQGAALGSVPVPVAKSPPAPPAAPSSPTAPTTTTTTKLANGPTALVTVASLHVRSGPGMKYAVQTTVVQGTQVTIISHKDGWYQVQLSDGTTGWIIASGIGRNGQTSTPSVTNPTSSAQATKVQPKAVSGPSVKASVAGLRIHSWPGLTAPVVTSVMRGQQMVVIGRKGGWLHVQVAGRTGWVSAAYTTGNAATTATTASTGSSYSSQKTVRPASATFHGSAATVAMNVRARPSMNGAVVTVLTKGATYRIIRWATNGWARVQTSTGLYGWVSGSVLGGQPAVTTTASRTPRAATMTSYTGHRLTAGVRIHAGPALNARVIGGGVAGTHVTVLGYRNGFAYVRLPNGITGYVYGSYVK